MICQPLLCLFFLISLGYSTERSIDLEQAWQRVLCYAPSIAIADQESVILEGEKRQVSLFPNPVAIFEGDHLSVGKDKEGVDPPEIMLGISQLIELGGKRTARRRLVEAVQSVAFYNTQIVRRDLHLALTCAFIQLCTTQEQHKLIQERQQLAYETWQAFECKLKAGQISPIQVKKAQLTFLAVEKCVAEICSRFEQQKKELSGFWGSCSPDFEKVAFPFFNYSVCPNFPSLVDILCHSLDYAKARAEIGSNLKNLKLQKIQRVPNVALTLGYQTFPDGCQQGWFVGAEVPLPWFDRNQGNIQKASAEVVRSKFHLEEVIQTVQNTTLILCEKMHAIYQELEWIHKESLVEASALYDLIQQGYQNGKYEYLELLEARQLLIDIKEKYLDALCAYHICRVELQQCIGQTICEH